MVSVNVQVMSVDKLTEITMTDTKAIFNAIDGLLGEHSQAGSWFNKTLQEILLLATLSPKLRCAEVDMTLIEKQK